MPMPRRPRRGREDGHAGTARNADQTTSGDAGTAPYALPGTTPDEQYQFAFDLMRQTKYADAEQALSTFVDEYPGSSARRQRQLLARRDLLCAEGLQQRRA